MQNAGHLEKGTTCDKIKSNTLTVKGSFLCTARTPMQAHKVYDPHNTFPFANHFLLTKTVEMTFVASGCDQWVWYIFATSSLRLCPHAIILGILFSLVLVEKMKG